ncbi:MAG: dienelactone hydrolase family protein [Chloroflexi bacterium]|nr:MAG: dienelactone hydrolase family protein [Chloroflexota bacterium]
MQSEQIGRPPTQPDGYLALPPAGKGPGVLVLHAWWGLNGAIKAFCERLAEAGFVAFAPDLYHGQVADTIAGAEILGSALDANHLQAKSEVAAAMRFLNELAGQNGAKGRPGLAVIGFSLGAYYALDLSVAEPEQIRAVVLFYGTGPGDFSRSQAVYLGHFAEEDEYEPQANVDELEADLRLAGRPVTFYRYPGAGHWFFEPDRADAYNEAAANLAWERTLAFLQGSPGD